MAFLREHAGENLLTCFSHLPPLRAIEQDRPFTLGDTGPQAHAALTLLQHAVDAQVKDWETFTRQAVEFHLKNARAWASTATGQDLTAQVDPGLIMGTQLTNPPGERVRSARCLDPRSEDSARRDGLAEKLLDDGGFEQIADDPAVALGGDGVAGAQELQGLGGGDVADVCCDGEAGDADRAGCFDAEQETQPGGVAEQGEPLSPGRCVGSRADPAR